MVLLSNIQLHGGCQAAEEAIFLGTHIVSTAIINYPIGGFTARFEQFLGRKGVIANTILFPLASTILLGALSPIPLPIVYGGSVYSFIEGFSSRHNELLEKSVARLICYATIDYRLSRMPKRVEDITEKNAVSTFVSTIQLLDEGNRYNAFDESKWELVSPVDQYERIFSNNSQRLLCNVVYELKKTLPKDGFLLDTLSKKTLEAIERDVKAQEQIMRILLMKRVLGKDICREHLVPYIKDPSTFASVIGNRYFVRFKESLKKEE